MRPPLRALIQGATGAVGSELVRQCLADDRFETTPEIEAFVREAGIRAVISTPLAGESGPLGVLSVVSRQPGRYTEADVDVLTTEAEKKPN